MNDAQNKYKNLVLEKQWNALSPEEEKLIALTARFEELKDKNLKLSKNLQPGRKSQKPNPKRTPNAKSNKKKDKEYAWKKVPPKAGQAHMINRDSKTYHWCPEHLAWCVHKPSDCKLKEQRENSINNSDQAPKDEKDIKQVAFSALEAILSE